MNTLLHRARSLTTVAALASILASAALSQCPAPAWTEMNPRWLPGGAKASIVYDVDGAGPQPPVLVLGSSTWGAWSKYSLVTWDGVRFNAFGSGVNNNGSIDAFTVYNGDLIAAGSFTSIDGVSASSVARWNGTSWQPLGAGIPGGVKALAVFQGDLVAGGSFTVAAGAPGNRLARWNGSTWQAIDLGLNDTVNALKVWNGKLVIGGAFTVAGLGAANRVATWDGAAWGTCGLAMSHGAQPVQVAALEIYNGELIAGGNFPLAGTATANFIARFDGTDWYDLGGGVSSTTGPIPQAFVRALTIYQGDLIAGGSFNLAGGVAANGVARWNGTSWQAMDVGIGSGLSSLTVFNSDLYAGGSTASGGVMGRSVARFDGTHWRPMGADLAGTILTLNVYDGELVAAGWLSGIGSNAGNRVVARWNGETWGTLGLGVNDRIDVLGVHNGVLYAGGGFTQTAEGIPAVGLVSWNGSAWLPVGGGTNGGVMALTVWNGDLIAGGYFTTAGGVAANRIVRWNGASWQPIGSGMNGAVLALTVWNGKLVAGGPFTQAGGTTSNGLASWDGTNWQPLGTGLSASTAVSIPSSVGALAVYGGELVVSGSFMAAGGAAAMHVARWNGTNWQSMGAGQVFAPSTLISYGGELVAVGSSPPQGWNGSTWNPLGVGPPNVKTATIFGGDLIVGGDFTTFSNPPYVVSPGITSWSSRRPLLSVSQPQGAGSWVAIADRRLLPGHEYFNFVSLDVGLGAVGTGPYGGLWCNDVGTLLWQASLPSGTAPFHFVTSTSEVTFGPYPLAPGLTFDAMCVDVTDGIVGCLAPAVRFTVQ